MVCGSVFYVKFYVKFWVNRPLLERNRRFSVDIRS